MVRPSTLLSLGALSYSQVNALPAIPVSQPKNFPTGAINALLAQEYLPPNNTATIQDDKFTKSLKVTIQYPAIDVFLEQKTFEERARDLLTQTLSSTLQQFGYSADQIQAKVDQRIPLLINAVKELVSDEDLTRRDLARRDLLDDLAEWGKEYGCGLVASAGVGLYLIAALDFIAGNSGGLTTTPEQDFFVFPVHGNLAHDESVQVFYRAHQNFAFQGMAGTTFGRNIYFPDEATTSFAEGQAAAFEFMTTNLIHELQHVKQYKQRGYNLHSFGLDYIYDWCYHGGYEKIPVEVEAYAIQKLMKDILPFSPATRKGNEFFQVWRTQKLGPTLGNPTQQTFSVIPALAANPPILTRELTFQKGIMQISDTTCFRTFSTFEIALRSSAQCDPSALCHKKRSPSPSPSPLCPINEDCTHPEPEDDPTTIPPPSPCTPAQQRGQDAVNAACLKARSDWAAVETGRKF